MTVATARLEARCRQANAKSQHVPSPVPVPRSEIKLWPKIAAVFEMPVAEPQTICLTQHMADKGALWREITVKHKLKLIPYMDLVAWPFADYVFGADWDVMSEVTKSRLYGFQDRKSVVVGKECA